MRKHQLSEHPLCERCLSVYARVTAATVVHHTVPHKGDAELFYSVPLASLCKRCHDSDMQEAERSGKARVVGIDGWSLPETKNK